MEPSRGRAARSVREHARKPRSPEPIPLHSLTQRLAGRPEQPGRRRPRRGRLPPREGAMPKFLIEREIPGAGKLGPAELQGISEKSCGVLREMGSRIQWLHSYVTGDKIYC